MRARFPRVQFIITAHNPIVVAGCLEDEVSVLRKNPEHGFSLVQFPNDFVGWQMEAIYRKVFEIEYPDESFARYDAMRPFKAELEQQAAALAEQQSRSNDENRSLDELEEKLLYIGKVEQTRSRRISQEELEHNNRALSDRLSALESAHQSAQEAQRDFDLAKRALEETKHRLQISEQVLKQRVRVLICIAVLLLLALAVSIFLQIERHEPGLGSYRPHEPNKTMDPFLELLKLYSQNSTQAIEVGGALLLSHFQVPNHEALLAIDGYKEAFSLVSTCARLVDGLYPNSLIRKSKLAKACACFGVCSTMASLRKRSTQRAI